MLGVELCIRVKLLYIYMYNRVPRIQVSRLSSSVGRSGHSYNGFKYMYTYSQPNTSVCLYPLKYCVCVCVCVCVCMCVCHSHNTGTTHWLDPRLSLLMKRTALECNENGK